MALWMAVAEEQRALTMYVAMLVTFFYLYLEIMQTDVFAEKLKLTHWQLHFDLLVVDRVNLAIGTRASKI